MRTRAWLFAAAMVLAFAGPAAAVAHPLGNFTINHLAIIDVRTHVVRVHYVLDIAEIPAFQITHAGSPDGMWSAAARDRWTASETALVAGGTHVFVDDAPVSLRAQTARVRLRPGAGGLPTLYWTGEFTAPLKAGRHHVRITDDVYAERQIGWKDIVVAPGAEPTHALTVYPNALLSTPRRVRAVSFDVSETGDASRVVSTFDAPGAAAPVSAIRSNALSDMLSAPSRTPWFVFVTLVVAFGLGALHALEPGHGKALLAVALVGSRATIRQAAILAAALTFAHTIGVLLLGAVLFFAASFVSESIYAWIALLSGAVVALIGARNLARYEHARAHDHGNAGHHHGDGNLRHSHAVPGSGPIEFRGAVAAAASGGVAPCPAAIVVMLAALRLHQIGYGMVLIVVFSLGLAAVLTTLGFAVVHGSAWLTRSGRFDRVVTFGPLASAVLISLMGAAMVGQGFAATGVPAPVWFISILAALAIAGYALSSAHAHVEAPQA